MHSPMRVRRTPDDDELDPAWDDLGEPVGSPPDEQELSRRKMQIPKFVRPTPEEEQLNPAWAQFGEPVGSPSYEQEL